MKRHLDVDLYDSMEKLGNFMRHDMMENPIAYIGTGTNCLQKEVNVRSLFVPPDIPEAKFHQIEFGIVLPKGSKLRPYLNSV